MAVVRRRKTTEVDWQYENRRPRKARILMSALVCIYFMDHFRCAHFWSTVPNDGQHGACAVFPVWYKTILRQVDRRRLGHVARDRDRPQGSSKTCRAGSMLFVKTEVSEFSPSGGDFSNLYRRRTGDISVQDGSESC